MGCHIVQYFSRHTQRPSFHHLRKSRSSLKPHYITKSPKATPSLTEASKKRASFMAQTFPKFLELPTEIRLKIYFQVLVMDKPILPTEVQPLGILQTCRLVYSEASEETYYQHNTFIIGDPMVKDDQWLAHIGDERRQMIRRVGFRDRPQKYLAQEVFDMLSQCSRLSLTMEITMAQLGQYLDDGNMDNFQGVPRVTSEYLCDGHQKESQQGLWEGWFEKLQEVKDHLESICAPSCPFHINKARLGPESAVHLRITHCCRRKHCCDPRVFPD